jgi:phosphoribosylaminoimidazolecarboxamide formyltransferase/IMP cyclohydrolase
MIDQDIAAFDLVVVNLYPFSATIARNGVEFNEAIEQIDIGGPSLLRAAAKNSEFVTVVCEPAQYAQVLEQIQKTGTNALQLRRKLMAEAFEHTAIYDRTIADYLARVASPQTFPDTIHLLLRRRADLRYGENEHQVSALYALPVCHSANVVNSRQLHGKQLSYNNLLDLDSALAIVRMFDRPAATVIKHNNPCGAAIGETLASAVSKAMAGDPISAFGSVIGVNRILDFPTADYLAAGEHFIEAIVAPDFEEKAFEILTTKPNWRKNVRLVAVGSIDPAVGEIEFRNLYGGMLVQSPDNQIEDQRDWIVVTEDKPSVQVMGELQFGWSIVRHVKSNAITISADLALCGVGAGQLSRVDAVELAIKKAGNRSRGAVLASDAFFPFADSIEIAAAVGIKAIIQPGGSIRDQEVTDACNRHGIPMVFTGRRHFRH